MDGRNCPIPDDGQDNQSTKTTGLVADQDPSHFAEDHKIRSRYIRNLLHNPPRASDPSPDLSDIPKTIVQYWHDPVALPADVKACLDSWTPLTTEGFTTILFDDATARHFILTALGHRYFQAFSLCYHPAMRCDYFRLCYIFLNGGFYVDADEVYQQTDCHHLFHDNCLKVQPLCYDTTSDTMVHRDAFIAQRLSSPSWIFYVNNNPLISPPRHPVLHLALERATRILLSGVGRPEIQDTTGPGNLSASLVRHAVSSDISGQNPGVTLLPNWEAISVSPWALSYRNDARNWRLL